MEITDILKKCTCGEVPAFQFDQISWDTSGFYLTSVYCPNCGKFTTFYYDKFDAIKAWNERKTHT